MRIVETNMVIEELAKMLSKDLVAPEWASFVKTGHGRQRPPVRDDWWQVRAASVLLKVKNLGPVGVSKLSVKYGNNKNRGVSPQKFARASRNILRKVLQQLEKAGYIIQAERGVHKGRILTQKGEKLIIEASKKASKSR